MARALGLASSALYRYFPSRDDLLTALIIEAYTALGDVVEAADASVDRGEFAARFVAVCRAARDWAGAHPHEYALIYGSPVPGYSAPTDTIGPASRVTLALVGIVVDAHRSGSVAPPADVAVDVPPGLRADIDALRIVAKGLRAVKEDRPDMGVVLITHYQRLLDEVTPDVVHIMVEGRIVTSGGMELARQLEVDGYYAFKEHV